MLLIVELPIVNISRLIATKPNGMMGPAASLKLKRYFDWHSLKRHAPRSFSELDRDALVPGASIRDLDARCRLNVLRPLFVLLRGETNRAEFRARLDSSLGRVARSVENPPCRARTESGSSGNVEFR